ncbi:MAG: YdeI/OmpD-associated family protein [Paracoccaceae bacterium]
MVLQRDENPMPDDVAARLDAAGLRAAYDARPPYQRNDYLGWIARAETARDPGKAPRPDARGARRRHPVHEDALGAQTQVTHRYPRKH